MYLLLAIHSIDIISFSLDLISFANRNIRLMRCKVALDITSFGLSLCMQTYFATSLTLETEEAQLALGEQSYANFITMRQWLCLEVGLSYLAILSQLLFFTYVYCIINTVTFQRNYHDYRSKSSLAESTTDYSHLKWQMLANGDRRRN